MARFVTAMQPPSIALLLFAGAMLCSCDRPAADLVIHNAVVLTMDEARPSAEAFWVRGGRIAAVGSSAEVLAQAGGTAERLDLQGRTVVPGFNDAHLHPLAVPPGAVSLADATDVEQVVAALVEGGRATPDSHWTLGFEYDDTLLGRHLDRKDLDRVSIDRPVLVWHASLHLMAVNSVALDVAGIDAETEDPAGGFFYRDEAGSPTGLISERSALEALFTDAQPTPMVGDLDSALAGLDRFVGRAHRLGITSITDALAPPELAIAYWLSSPEESGIRVNLLLDGEDLSGAKWLLRFNDLVSWIGWSPLDNPWLRARSIKIFHGLSLSGRTARLYEAYADRPDYFGEDPQRSQSELNELVREIQEAGFQAAVHTNGDYEIDMVLDAIEAAAVGSDEDPRHRIEHGSVVNEEILARMKQLGVVYAPHSYVYEKGPMLEPYGEDRWDRMFANASSFEYGIPNAANSDYPVSGLNPMLRIQSLVTRRSRGGKVYGPRQRIRVEQALYAYTMGGAYASFEEEDKGSISVGKYADFVVLSEDPRSVPPDLLSRVVVLQTFVNGVSRFTRSEPIH